MARRTSTRARHRIAREQSRDRAGRKGASLFRRVRDYLAARPRASFRVRDLAREFSASSSEEREISDIVRKLQAQGLLRRIKGKRYQHIDEDADNLIGRLDQTNSGSGFVKTEGAGEDVFLPRSRLLGARHGDQVEVAITGRGRYGRPTGRVVRVVERDETPVVGRFITLPGRGGLVYPDNPRVPGPIHVNENLRRGAKHDDRVQVKLDTHARVPSGRIVRVFGPGDDPKVRFSALLAEYRFRENFSATALAEAHAADGKISAEEMKRREDFRDRFVITIDPASAKDFDDALSLRRVKGGKYELGVHIADVSWYVRPGAALDKEARARGTSVYSAHGTQPMLPHALSSDLCSLREGELRRAMSVLITLAPDGTVVNARPCRSVIRSSRRLTYEQAQDLIDSGRERWGDQLPPLRKDSLAGLLHHLAALARNLRARRFKKGGLDLDLPEYEIEFDEQGEVCGIRRRPVLESNHLIEEFMLAANRAVTEFVHRSRESNPRVFVYRVHDRPEPEKLEELIAKLDGLGIEWPFSRVNLENIPSKAFNDWLAGLENNPLRDIIRYLTLRAMAKAAYDTDNIGHFGLGFTNYTHFTSPIRRYPDLVVHRIINAILERTTKYGPGRRDELQRDCEISSERERAAQELERASLKIRQAEYFARKIGEVFEGMIVGAIQKGVFVEIEGTGAQGMILGDDLGAVFFDRELHGFVEIGGDRLFRPGTRLKVRVLDADPDLGRFELEPA
ncbi:MAG: Ribonuclease R [Calditrichaeota bacterium]|nr:Ribonuclease R [Calditrichota bacterium]